MGNIWEPIGDTTPTQASVDAAPTWGDYLSTLVNVGGAELVSALPAASRYIAEQFDNPVANLVAKASAYGEGAVADYAADSIKKLSPAMQQRLSAPVTSEEFWAHPVSSAAAKLTRMGPSTLAAVGSVLTTAPAWLALGVASGGLSAAQTIDDAYKEIDNMTDAELMRSDYYAGLRAKGVSEDAARKDISKLMLGAKPAMLFALGAITGNLGAPGQIARALGVKGTAGAIAEGGILARAGKGFAVGGGTEFVQSGAETATTEYGNVDAGLQEKADTGAIINAALEGGLLGGIMGGIADAAPHRSTEKTNAPAKPGAKPNSPAPSIQVKPPEAVAPLDVMTPPTPPGVVPDPVDAPKKKTRYPKKKVATGTEAVAEVTGEGNTPTSEVAIALEAAKKPQQVVAPPVEAPAPPISAPPEGVSAPTPTPVPPTPEAPVQAPEKLAPEAVSPTPVEPPPVAPAEPQPEMGQPPVNPLEQAPRSGRILQDMSPRAVENARLQGENAARVRENIKGLKEEGAITPDEQGNLTLEETAPVDKEAQRQEANASKWNKVKRARAEKTNARATALFDEIVPEKPTVPSSPEEVKALYDRVSAGIKAIEDDGVTIPDNFKDNTLFNDKVLWLREAADFVKAGNRRTGTPPDAEAVLRFVKRSADIREGRVAEALAERRAEGDIAKRGQQKDLGEISGVSTAQSAPVAEETAALGEQDTTGLTEDQASDFGPEQGSESAVPTATTERGRSKMDVGEVSTPENPKAGEVKKVAITDEIKAKALAALEAAAAKNKGGAKVAEVKAKAKVEAEAPKPAPAEKVAEIKAKAKEKAAPKEKKETKAQAAARRAAEQSERDSEALRQSVAKPNLEQVGKAKLAAEAAKTESNPTEAQKKVGNYPKGHLPIAGFKIAIETAKGDFRRGVDALGRAWEVRMGVHYGHLLGTKGADGDPMDVYLGPKAWPGNPLLKDLPVIVIDQNTLEGNFDEHKVMLGFDDVRHAIETYDKSFSDGRGAERVGDVRVFSPDEFKTWLENPSRRKTAPAGVDTRTLSKMKSPADIYADLAAQRGLTPAELDALFEAEKTAGLDFGLPPDYGTATLLPPEGAPEPMPLVEWLDSYSKTKTNLGSVAKLAVEKLADFQNALALGVVDNDVPNKLTAVLAPRMMKHLADMVHDLPVYILDDADFNTYFADENTAGAFLSRDNIMILPERVLKRTAFEDYNLPRVLLHETAHAAFMNVFWKTPTARALIEHMAHKVLDWAETQPNEIYNEISGLYAFSEPDEFVAEAFSNVAFQALLAKIPADERIAQSVEASRRRVTGRGIMSLWDAFASIVKKALGISNKEMTILEGVMHLGSNLQQIAHATEGFGPIPERRFNKRMSERLSRTSDERGPWVSHSMYNITEGASAFKTRAVKDLNTWLKGDRQEQMGVPWMLRFRTMDNVARTADYYFGKANNPVRKVADILENTAHKAKVLFNETIPLIKKMDTLERKYLGPVWDSFTTLVHDETMAGVYADRPLAQQPHLGKNRLDRVWNKAQHPDLAQRWAALPQDLKQLRTEAMEYFTKQQNAMSLGIIKNQLLKALGIDDAALATRIHEGTTTPADDALLGPELLDHIKDAKELAKIEGPYFPLMRRGDHVVQALYKVKPPLVTLKGIEVKDDDGNVLPNVHDFTDRKAAEAYAKSQTDLNTTIDSRWVDKATGKRYITDANGNVVRITKSDANAEQRFRVTIQNLHVEFVQGKNAALRLAHDLAQAGLEVKGVEERRLETAKNIDLQSWQMRRLAKSLEQRKGYADLTQLQKNDLVQAFNTASLSMLGSTRVQARRLPRRYVAGFSTNLTQNTVEYARSAAGYLAKLDNQPRLDAAMKEMEDSVTSDYGKADASLSRSSIANVVRERVSSDNGTYEGGKFSPLVNRVLAWSFLDKLASPAYSLVNATQPMMLTYPVLAARYGAGRAFNEMAKAYRDIGATGVIAQGIKATKDKALRPSEETGSFIEDILARLPANAQRMLRTLIENGTIDPDAGLELGDLIASRKHDTTAAKLAGKFDAGVSYFEGMARQMPKSIEAINRTVTALAAYRMELERNGGDHDAATSHAQDTVNATQFNYSPTNAPPIFNHPLARLSFQFKKFALGIYQLLGQQVSKAIHNAEPGDRAEALKSLAYIAATHTLMAGTLGLPTEPIKMLVLAAGATGLSDLEWKDVENWEREAAASILGTTAGEALTRGVTRAIPGGFAFDLSTRLGLDSLLTFKEPDSNKPDDAKAWVADTLGGAPWALGWDWYKGVQQLADGDIVKAGETLVPLKVFADSIKAYRVATEGKKTGTGRESMSPYNLPEIATRAIGFTPGREAESSDQGNQYFSRQKRQTEARSSYMQRWAQASGVERARLWGEVETWNKGRDKTARITRAELDAYAKRRKTEDKKGTYKGGQKVGKRDAGLYKELEGIYNAN